MVTLRIFTLLAIVTLWLSTGHCLHPRPLRVLRTGGEKIDHCHGVSNLCQYIRDDAPIKAIVISDNYDSADNDGFCMCGRSPTQKLRNGDRARAFIDFNRRDYISTG